MFGTYLPPTPEHLKVQGLRYGRNRYLDIFYWFKMPFIKNPEQADPAVELEAESPSEEGHEHRESKLAH